MTTTSQRTAGPLKTILTTLASIQANTIINKIHNLERNKFPPLYLELEVPT